MFAVVLTGPPGAGQTSVLTALSDALSDDDIAHAAVEVEALVWTHAALGHEQRLRYVQTACALHRDAGYRLLLVAKTIESSEDLAELRNAAAADDGLVVRLEARPATLVKRIIQEHAVERDVEDCRAAPAVEPRRRAFEGDAAGGDEVAQLLAQRPQAQLGRARRPGAVALKAMVGEVDLFCERMPLARNRSPWGERRQRPDQRGWRAYFGRRSRGRRGGTSRR